MKLRGIESQIYTVAFALAHERRISAGLPQSWREQAFATDGERIAAWEDNVALCSIEDAQGAVLSHRRGRFLFLESTPKARSR